MAQVARIRPEPGRDTDVRLLIISQNEFPPHSGGITTLMSGLARALGPARAVCCGGGPRKSQDDDLGLQIFRPGRHGHSRLATASLALAVLRGWWAFKPQAVIFSALSDAAYIGPLVKRVLRLPYAIFVHDTETLVARADGGWGRARRALLQADQIIALSRFSSGLVEGIGVPAARIAMIRPGCDPVRFSPGEHDPAARARRFGARPDSTVLLSVASLRPRKGQDLVLRALPAVLERHPDVVYVMAGRGGYRDELEALAARLGVEDKIRFLGEVPDSELPELYRQADIFVMPSRPDPEPWTGGGFEAEGFGLVYLEAAAASLPVIGGRSGGVADAVADGRTGILVDPESPAELSEALLRLLDEPALAREMGAAGRRRVLEEGYTWPEAAAQVVALMSAHT